MRSKNTDLKRGKAYFKPEWSDLRPKRKDIRTKRADFRPGRADFRLERSDGGHEWMDGQTDGLTNKSPPVFYRTLSPSGLLPCLPSLQFTITQSRATGIADHILRLDDLLLYRLRPVDLNL